MNGLLKDYGFDIDWNVGSLFCHDDSIIGVNGIHSICYRLNVQPPIKHVFGGISSLLAGGRIPSPNLDVDRAIDIAKTNMQNGLACRLTLSNPNISMTDINKDKNVHHLLSFLDSHCPFTDKKHGVILSSDILAEYARMHYPNLEIILSTIRTAYDVGYGKNNDTVHYYTKLLNNPLYDIVVVNAAKIDEANFFDSLPNKGKIEVIVCNGCIKNCPYAKSHYDYIHSYIQLQYYDKDVEILLDKRNKIKTQCIANKSTHLNDYSSFTFDEIKHLGSIGIRKFKIAGRTNSSNTFNNDLRHYLFNYEMIKYLDTFINQTDGILNAHLTRLGTLNS